jgi:uroporphyrinogen decarboxylase
MMTNKERLQAVFDGTKTDRVPYFELGFQLEKEMFGIDFEAVRQKIYGSESAKNDAILKTHIEIQRRLVEELGWAAAFFAPDFPPSLGVTAVKKALGDKALIHTHVWEGVYCMPSGAEFVEFITRMFERPEEMHAEARRKCDRGKELLKIQADCGADFFILAFDFGFNEGPFISPACFKEFVAPYLTEMVQTVHSLGKKALLHSDGDLRQILDQIYGTGIDGWQSIDPQGHMDIRKVRDQYPDWILMGNVKCSLLQDAIEPEIRESVRYCMKYGGIGKRYIFSASNVIFAGMPVESYNIMVDEFEKQQPTLM